MPLEEKVAGTRAFDGKSAFHNKIIASPGGFCQKQHQYQNFFKDGGLPSDPPCYLQTGR
jgi:hypothetical protein